MAGNVKHNVKPGVETALDRLRASGDPITSSGLAHAAGVSRQAAQARLGRLVREGVLSSVGAGRATRYVVAPLERPAKELGLPVAGLSEDAVWKDVVAKDGIVAALAEHPRSIFQYAFTELLNNAIDHSNSPDVVIRLGQDNDRVWSEIVDRGVGVFEKIRRAYGLPNYVDAIGELAKGKVTTDPERHTGEGIFFVSKAAEYFELNANGWSWLVDNARNDTAIAASPQLQSGTRARFEVDKNETRSLEQLFGEYTRDLAFDTTRIRVKLFSHGVRFVSRSEARRLMQRLDRFREVILDFEGVEGIGQGFADEVFRVWARAHPDVSIKSVNMNSAVEFMVQRALVTT
jgi:hypothetical protein